MRGHVRQRDNRWCAIYDLPRDSSGKRRQRWQSGFASRQEAAKALREALSKIDKGTFVAPSKQTLALFLDEWYEATRATRRETTNATYSAILSTLRSRIGGTPLQALTPMTLNALYADLQREGSSPATVRYVHAVIRKALSDAVRWNLCERNVALSADPPRAVRTQTRTWTARELAAFLDAVADDRLFAAYVLAATTGMRRGEVLGLRWQDVDLDAGRVSVSQTLVAVGSEVRFSEPKSAKGRRMVALDSRTLAALKEHRKRQIEERESAGGAYDDRDLVFANTGGAAIHPDAFSDAFRRHVARAGLPKIRLHDLRHTHATLALAAGIHPKVVQERLGHSSVSITLDRYSHAIPAMQETAAEQVAALVFDDRLEIENEPESRTLVADEASRDVHAREAEVESAGIGTLDCHRVPDRPVRGATLGRTRSRERRPERGLSTRDLSASACAAEGGHS